MLLANQFARFLKFLKLFFIQIICIIYFCIIFHTKSKCEIGFVGGQYHEKLSNFSGFTIFEFINQDKVTFFSARTFPIFTHFPRQVDHTRFPSISFLLERDPKNIFYYQCDVESYTDPGPRCPKI